MFKETKSHYRGAFSWNPVFGAHLHSLARALCFCYTHLHLYLKYSTFFSFFTYLTRLHWWHQTICTVLQLFSFSGIFAISRIDLSHSYHVGEFPGNHDTAFWNTLHVHSFSCGTHFVDLTLWPAAGLSPPLTASLPQIPLENEALVPHAAHCSHELASHLRI